MSYLTQMLGLTVQNFVSAATGMAVLMALIRGFARQNAQAIGNFWVDLTRGTLYILLPLAFVFSLVLVGQGMPQTFSAYQTVPLVESIEYDTPKLDASGQPVKDAGGNAVTEKATQKEQSIAVGPVASQVAIKQLGTNGGGFFNANSAHPFENPTPLSNFLELLAILLIPAALCYTFGKMVGDTRQGWAILAAMTIVFVVLLAVCAGSEQAGNPAFAKLGVDQAASLLAGGRKHGRQGDALRRGQLCAVGHRHHRGLERLGKCNARLVHAAGGTGADVADPDRRGHLRRRGLRPVRHVAAGRGRSVRRRPHDRPHARVPRQENRGFRHQDGFHRRAGTLVHGPRGTAAGVLLDAGKAGVANPGAHAFSEILYAFSSASGNNGSAFAGLSANTPFYNTALGIVMFFARFWIIVPVLALAGSLVAKKKVPAGPGTLPTHTPLFIFFLIGVVVVIGALTFFPALALGPIVEHLMLYGGK